jgi:hypothetical protein
MDRKVENGDLASFSKFSKSFLEDTPAKKSGGDEVISSSRSKRGGKEILIESLVVLYLNKQNKIEA